MREAIGGSQILNLILIFVGIIIVLLVGSLSYSKVFKIKTRIISIIENNNGYNNNEVRTEIENYLRSAGYTVAKTSESNKCAKVNGSEAINNNRNYDYCVYSFDTVRGKYYRVTVFISYDIPIVSTYLRIPVSGETRIIYGL